MHIERLTRMRDLLCHDAAKPDGIKFDLSTWAQPSDGELKGHWKLPEDVAISDDYRYYTAPKPREIAVDCGTTACAMGLAAISGEFEKDGLTYAFTLSDDGTGVLLPQLGKYYGFEAAAELFDIGLQDAYYLFDPAHYDSTPQGADGERFVAQRIDDFIEGIIDHAYHPDWSKDDEDYED